MYIDPEKLTEDGYRFQKLFNDLRRIGVGADRSYETDLAEEVKAQLARARFELSDEEFGPLRGALELLADSDAGPEALWVTYRGFQQLGKKLVATAADYVVTDDGIYADFDHDGRPDPVANGQSSAPIERKPR